MANEEQLPILRQGVEVWNKWREGYPNREVNLSGANLVRARLGEVNFSIAILKETNLKEASLIGADLNSADLDGANLMFTYFNKADLTGTHLDDANLTKAVLEDANLSNASLGFVIFRGAIFTRANFEGAFFHSTYIANVDLSEVRCLDKTFHGAPSTLEQTLLRYPKAGFPKCSFRIVDKAIGRLRLRNCTIPN